jgi:transposase-like protein
MTEGRVTRGSIALPTADDHGAFLSIVAQAGKRGSRISRRIRLHEIPGGSSPWRTRASHGGGSLEFLSTTGEAAISSTADREAREGGNRRFFAHA